MTYRIEEHRHRFSVWAAARGTQRGFSNVEKLRKALESSGVQAFLGECGVESVDQAKFEGLHRSWCRAIMAWLTDAGVRNVTFGRAAKLVALYLKSMVVLGGHADSALGRVAHPPIDAILLRNLARASEAEVVSPHKREWAKLRWTSLDEEAYYGLIAQLRAVLPPDAPFWTLERYWTVTDGGGL